MINRFIYSGSILIMQSLLRLVGVFDAKADEMTRGRKGWQANALKSRPEGKLIWFHCASVGEFEQAKPVIELMKSSRPELKVLITVFSPSGIEPAKKYKQADMVCYLPFDTAKNAELFIEMMKPEMAIFIKYEFWYHFLQTLKSKSIPVFSVSAIFRKEQRFFRKNSSFFKSMLYCFNHFFVQTAQSEELLASIGLTNVTVTGDTRMDRVLKIASSPMHIPVAQAFSSDDQVMVIGSSWHQDMEILFPIINDERIHLKFIIAPHEISDQNVRSITSRLTIPFSLFSIAKMEDVSGKRALIIDNIGMLSSLYQFGTMAYIGGAFHQGLHNILEPAAFGIPVLFGRDKSNKKFQEAVDLVAIGGAFEVDSSADIKNLVQKIQEDRTFQETVSMKVVEYTSKNAGASARVASHILTYLS